MHPCSFAFMYLWIYVQLYFVRNSQCICWLTSLFSHLHAMFGDGLQTTPIDMHYVTWFIDLHYIWLVKHIPIALIVLIDSYKIVLTYEDWLHCFTLHLMNDSHVPYCVCWLIQVTHIRHALCTLVQMILNCIWLAYSMRCAMRVDVHWNDIWLFAMEFLLEWLTMNALCTHTYECLHSCASTQSVRGLIYPCILCPTHTNDQLLQWHLMCCAMIFDARCNNISCAVQPYLICELHWYIMCCASGIWRVLQWYFILCNLIWCVLRWHLEYCIYILNCWSRLSDALFAIINFDWIDMYMLWIRANATHWSIHIIHSFNC